MGSQEALLAGASIGLAIAAPIGPVAVMVVRRTLASGFLAGVATGAGASTINLIYAASAIGGLDRIATSVQSVRDLLTTMSALALLFFSIRMLRPRSAGANAAAAPGQSLLRHYMSAVALNSVNPMGFALMLGAVTAAAGVRSEGASGTGLLALGVFLGSIAWWLGLVSATATVGVRLSPNASRVIDFLAAIALLGLAASTMSRLL